MDTKVCKACGEEKLITEFYLNKTSRGGRTNRCKPCELQANRESKMRVWGSYNKAHYANKIKAQYGLEWPEYEALLEAQGGVCAICKRTDKRRTFLCVDHDHETGKVRGLLCTACNRALGLLQDKPDIVEAAARYIREH